jgi:hypothetical protein
MFQVGDIVRDISAEYADCDFTGIIISAAIVFGQPIFHIRFFDSPDELIALKTHEIQKVS